VARQGKASRHCQDIIDKEKPMKVSECAERLNVGVNTLGGK
jgi:hypothetical protein